MSNEQKVSKAPKAPKVKFFDGVKAVCKKDVNLWEKRQVMRKPLKRTLSKA